MIRRILRVACRQLRHILRPLRLRWIARQMQQSERQIERLRDLRAATIELEQSENRNQVRLAVRRVELLGS